MTSVGGQDERTLFRVVGAVDAARSISSAAPSRIEARSTENVIVSLFSIAVWMSRSAAAREMTTSTFNLTRLRSPRTCSSRSIADLARSAGVRSVRRLAGAGESGRRGAGMTQGYRGAAS